MKKLLKYLLLGAIGVATYSPVLGQMEHKITTYGFLGFPIFSADKIIQEESVLSGYSAVIPYLGYGAKYAFNNKLSAGANFKVLYSPKKNYVLNHQAIGISLKYNFVPFDKKISPFVYAEANTGRLNIYRSGRTETIYPQINNPEHVSITEQERKLDEASVTSFVTGALLGAGVDFTLKQKYGMFISLNYQLTDADKSREFRSVFTYNKSKFNFLMLQTGIRFSFLRKKSLY